MSFYTVMIPVSPLKFLYATFSIVGVIIFLSTTCFNFVKKRTNNDYCKLLGLKSSMQQYLIFVSLVIFRSEILLSFRKAEVLLRKMFMVSSRYWIRRYVECISCIHLVVSLLCIIQKYILMFNRILLKKSDILLEMFNECW